MGVGYEGLGEKRVVGKTRRGIGVRARMRVSMRGERDLCVRECVHACEGRGAGGEACAETRVVGGRVGTNDTHAKKTHTHTAQYNTHIHTFMRVWALTNFAADTGALPILNFCMRLCVLPPSLVRMD